MRSPPITAPDRDTRAWIEGVVGSARVIAARRLTGGITSAVHRVTLEDGGGVRSHVVLRRYTQPETDRTRSFVEQEARILTQLAETAIPAPRLIAADPSGVPSLLMTHLPGRMDLAPKEPERFIRQMSDHLVRIHEADVDGRPFDRAVKPTPDRIPSGTSDRAVWLRALDLMHGAQPAYAARFLHRDYQHFNMLWSRGRLTGIVDWPFASMGPREIDVGHCRLNLAALFSVEWAERLRVTYEAETGHVLDPWWDIHAIWSFHDVWQEFIPRQVGGRIPVDLNGMWRRVDELLTATLKRT